MRNMSKTDITAIVKKLFRVAKAKYGEEWQTKVRTAIWDNREGYPRKLQTLNKFYESQGFKILGCGMYRTVFGYKDVVIKIDNPRMNGNEEEVEVYKETLGISKLAKYLMCPLLKKIKVGKSLVLIYPKVEVLGDMQTYPSANHENRMLNLHSSFFSDMHDMNIGKFGKGFVAIDINFGSNAYSSSALDLSHFSQKHKAFWKAHVKAYDTKVKQLKREYAL